MQYRQVAVSFPPASATLFASRNAKVMAGTPAAHGFHMPAEWEPHDQCWIGWPNPVGAWGTQWRTPDAQRAFADVVAAISKFEPVAVCTNAAQYNEVYDLMKDNSNVRVVEMSMDLVWLRDLGPTFVVQDSEKGSQRQIAGVDWRYNGYGGPKMHPSFEDRLNWRKKIVSQMKKCFRSFDRVASSDEETEEIVNDNLVARKVLELERIPRFETEFVLEGGSIHVDGEGTCITTEQCLLHGNRNPNLTKEQIEDHLRMYLGVSKIIWLPQGLYGDDFSSGGHVDNICCFVRPGVVLLAWVDDEYDPQYERSFAAFSVLSKTTDAKGRKLEIIKIHLPGPFKSAGVTGRLPASYVNFYIANGGIIVPAFGDKWDKEAYKVLKKAFPDHKVVMVEGGKHISHGGGNIHCTTQQQPALY